MERFLVEVARRRSVRGGDAFEVFGDGGSGTIDPNAPLTDRPIRFWEGLPLHGGHLEGGHLTRGHLDQIIPPGHLAGRHLSAEHLWPADSVWFVTLPLYFGRFQFAVGSVDAFGNRSAALSSAVSRVVNSSPRSATGLKRGVFDEVSRRMSLTFEPSPDL